MMLCGSVNWHTGLKDLPERFHRDVGPAEVVIPWLRNPRRCGRQKMSYFVSRTDLPADRIERGHRARNRAGVIFRACS
jgi:hypothetical protein